LPPTTPNAAPEIVACEMSTVAEPEFVIVSASVLLLPTATPPKLKAVELVDRVPAGAFTVVLLAALVV